MRHAIFLAMFATWGLVACGGHADGASVAAPGDSDRASHGPCPEDGERLPVSGICAARAVNYLNVAGGMVPDPPEGCEWTVQETRFASDLLLYRAARCGTKTTRLAFAAGAGMAELSYDTAAFGDPDNKMKGEVVVRVADLDPADRTAAILRTARSAIDNSGERAACRLRNARIEGWPEDALVVDSAPAGSAEIAADGPRSACGPFGLDEDSSAFWRVFQGYSWFFDLGQDVWQVDPGSFTLLTKSPDGGWTQIE